MARCCQLLDEHVSVDFVVRSCDTTKLIQVIIGSLTHMPGFPNDNSMLRMRRFTWLASASSFRMVPTPCESASQSCNDALVSSESPLKIPPTVLPAGHQHGVSH